MTVALATPRLTLRSWEEGDRDAFADLMADPVVMADFGGPLSRAESDARFDGYRRTFAQAAFCRLAVIDRAGAFLGYVGLMPSRADHPLGPHVDIGWRLTRPAWGRGYATEAARAVLADGFARLGLAQIIAATAADNTRSQAVMARLGMTRVPALDYDEPFGDGMWHGLVWVARPPVS